MIYFPHQNGGDFIDPAGAGTLGTALKSQQPPSSGRVPSRYRSTTVRGAPLIPAINMIPASVRTFPASGETRLHRIISTSSARSFAATACGEGSAQTRWTVRRTVPFSTSKIANAAVIPKDGAT